MNRARIWIFAASLSLVAACITQPGGQAGGSSAVGSASAAIAVVPPSVSCVRILAAGSRSVSTDFDVTPGQSALLVMNDLPVGDVTFSAYAYASPCAFASGTQPTWSARPTAAVISAGQQTHLALHLGQVGSAGIDITFDGPDGGADDDGGTGGNIPDLGAPMCTPSGATCTSNNECCSGMCEALFLFFFTCR
jgi:hypothetical protein